MIFDIHICGRLRECDFFVALSARLPSLKSQQRRTQTLGVERAQIFRASSLIFELLRASGRAEPRLIYGDSSFKPWISSFEPYFNITNRVFKLRASRAHIFQHSPFFERFLSFLEILPVLKIIPFLKIILFYNKTENEFQC